MADDLKDDGDEILLASERAKLRDRETENRASLIELPGQTQDPAPKIIPSLILPGQAQEPDGPSLIITPGDIPADANYDDKPLIVTPGIAKQNLKLTKSQGVMPKDLDALPKDIREQLIAAMSQQPDDGQPRLIHIPGDDSPGLVTPDGQPLSIPDVGARPSLKIREEAIEKAAQELDLSVDDTYIALAQQHAESNPMLAKALADCASERFAKAEPEDTIESFNLPHSREHMLGDIYTKVGDSDAAIRSYEKAAEKDDDVLARVKQGKELVDTGRRQEGIEMLLEALRKMRRGDRGAHSAVRALEEDLDDDAPERDFLESRRIEDYAAQYDALTETIWRRRVKFKADMQNVMLDALADFSELRKKEARPRFSDINDYDSARETIIDAVYCFLKSVIPTGYDPKLKGLDDDKLREQAGFIVDHVNLKPGQIAARFRSNDGFGLVQGFMHYLEETCEDRLKTETLAEYICLEDEAERDSFAAEYIRDRNLEPSEERIEVVAKKLGDRIWDDCTPRSL